MAGRSGQDGDPMDLYQVFQSSYNKITKNEYSCSEPYNAPSHDLYQPESRFFPFDARSQGKCEKPGDERQWYGESPVYPDPSVYYPVPPEQDWGYSHYSGAEPSPHLPYPEPGAGYGPAATPYLRPAPAPAQHLDDAINILRNHVDFNQVEH